MDKKLKKKSVKKKSKKDVYDGKTPLKSVLMENFVQNIISGLPQFKAYEQAGYAKGQTENALMASSSALLRNPKVNKRLRFLRGSIAKKEEITHRKTLREAARLSFSDVTNILDDNGCVVKDLKSLPVDVRRAISSIEVFEEYQGKGKNRKFIGYTKKVKFWDKNKALEKLFKHLNLYAEHEKEGATKFQMNFIDIVAKLGGLRRGVDSRTS